MFFPGFNFDFLRTVQEIGREEHLQYDLYSGMLNFNSIIPALMFQFWFSDVICEHCFSLGHCGHS